MSRSWHGPCLRAARARGLAEQAPPRLDALRDRWHAASEGEVQAALATDPKRGLDEAEARRRLAVLGPNALPEARAPSLFAIVVRQIRSPLVYLLFAAAAVALLLGERGDAAVIFGAVVVNAAIGAFQDRRAERSLAALRRLASLRARVRRDGRERTVEAAELVPGDVLVLAAGDAVAADARLVAAASLSVAEAALTGESLPVAKTPAPLPADTPLADRLDMVYAATHVTQGRGTALVVATGPASEIGRIAHLTGSAEERQTPLERRVEQFGRVLVVAALVLVAAILALGLARGLSFRELFLVAVSQMVSMVPEGLPVAMTIALAVGVQRMADRRTIVRRLAAVETLGSTTVICTDKTGTLTRNEMTATRVWLPDGRTLAVTGAGYEPRGRFEQDGRAVDPARDAGLRALLEACALCNDAELRAPAGGEGAWGALGDPTEAALLALAAKGGVDLAAARAQRPRRAELPFDADAKMMATQHDGCVLIKGAPEVVEAFCADVLANGREAPFDDAARAAFRAAVQAMGDEALRVLALARADGAALGPDADAAALRGRATLLGLVGQIDPPRHEVAEAVAACRGAGIRPVMVTGDHAATGLAIARGLGIAREGDLAVDGRELAALSDDELAQRLDRISVFARVPPAEKLRLVAAYQRRGDVVAMTGDGVNDAPALARADVGVAMGVTGTEVAKQASDVVIADDHFATIVAAVAEGRAIHRNLKNLVLYLFSTNAAEVVVLFAALLAGQPLPLAAVQILWINLVTDSAIAVNLVMEPAEGDELRRPPVPPREPLLSRALLLRMALMVPAMAASTLGWYAWRLASGVPYELVRTETFTVLVVCQWFNALGCRSDRHSAFAGVARNRWLLAGLATANAMQIAVVYWPPLARLFRTVPIDPAQILPIGAVASLVLWVEEARKWMVRMRLERSRPSD